MKKINDNLFGSAFNSHIVDESKYKPVTDEQAKEILTRSLQWHDEVYLPAEQKEKEKLGRDLSFIEQMELFYHIKYGE